MDFTHDEEQQALRDAVRGLVGKAYGSYEDRRRRVDEDPGYSTEVWQQLAQMGVLGLPFAEEDGGSGAGPVEVAVVAEELGRVLAPEPFLGAVVVAGGLVAAAGSPQQRSDLLGSLASGEQLLAFAHSEPGAGWTTSAGAVGATGSGEQWTLTGVKEPVPHGAEADRLVVSAHAEGSDPSSGTGTRLFLVDPTAAGVTREGHRTLDGGRAARITFDGAPAVPLGEGGEATGVIRTVLDTARVIAGNQAVGAMEVALQSTSEYLTSRKQFGVPLNTFQALTFRAADCYVDLELARSMVAWATMVLAEAPEQLHEAATRAGLQVSRSGRHIGQEAIQLHGGIGMTAEYAIGAYAAHLALLEQWFGHAQRHLGELAADVRDHAEVDPLG